MKTLYLLIIIAFTTASLHAQRERNLELNLGFGFNSIESNTQSQIQQLEPDAQFHFSESYLIGLKIDLLRFEKWKINWGLNFQANIHELSNIEYFPGSLGFTHQEDRLRIQINAIAMSLGANYTLYQNSDWNLSAEAGLGLGMQRAHHMIHTQTLDIAFEEEQRVRKAKDKPRNLEEQLLLSPFIEIQFQRRWSTFTITPFIRYSYTYTPRQNSFEPNLEFNNDLMYAMNDCNSFSQVLLGVSIGLRIME